MKGEKEMIMKARKRVALFSTASVIVVSGLLAGCGSDDKSESLPDVVTTTVAPAGGQNVVGLLKSANNTEVVLSMPGGVTRTFKIKPEDRDSLGVPHLASHAGLTDIGFKVTYVSEGGQDYIKSASETSPPKG
jgi:hypothetical protein